MTARKMYRVQREYLEAKLRTITQEPLQYWQCSCGCNAGIIYARDARALWIASEMSSDEMFHIVGLQTEAELNQWLALMTAALNDAEKRTECVAVFTAAFTAGKPS